MANNLAAIRKSLGLTQPELAERMGTTKNQLIKLEKGDRKLTEEWIEKAAKATGVAIEKFVMEGFQPGAVEPLSLTSDDDRPDAESARLLAQVRDLDLLDDVKAYMRWRIAGGGTSGGQPPAHPDPTAPKVRKPR